MRKLVVLLALGAVLALSGLAVAKTKTVHYSGYEGKPPYTPLERVVFSVTGSKVTGVSFVTGFLCGGTNPLVHVNTAVKFPIDKHHSFQGKVTVGKYHFKVGGKFSGKSLTGTISATAAGCNPRTPYGYSATKQ